MIPALVQNTRVGDLWLHRSSGKYICAGMLDCKAGRLPFLSQWAILDLNVAEDQLTKHDGHPGHMPLVASGEGHLSA